MANVLKKRRVEKKEVIYLGVLVPKEVASFLSLHTTARSITKTKIVIDLLNQWKIDCLKKQSEFDYIKEIVELSWESWKTYPLKRTTFYAFCHKLRSEFKYKGLEPETIEIIINKLKYEKEEDDRR